MKVVLLQLLPFLKYRAELKWGGAETHWMYLYISLTGRAPLLLDFKAIPISREYEQSGRACVCSTTSRLPWEILLWGGTGGEPAGGKRTALGETVAARWIGEARSLVGFALALEWISAPNVQLLAVPSSRRLDGDCGSPRFCIMQS